MQVEQIAKTIWTAESLRTVGRKRFGTWEDVNENDKAKYRFVAQAILESGAAYRHKARGSEYTEMGIARLQVEGGRGCRLQDGERMRVYRAEDGSWWVRSEREFDDGRFERIG